MVPGANNALYLGATAYFSRHPQKNIKMRYLFNLQKNILQQFNRKLEGAEIIKFFYGNRPVTIDGFPVCGMIGIDIYSPSLPHIMVYLHTDKLHMQQSVSIYLLGMGSSLLFYGPLSDQYGRKPLVIIGLAVACISSFLTIFCSTIHIFLLLRLFQGIGCGVCMGLGRTIIADILQGPRLASIASYLALVISLSPLLAPMLGGYIQYKCDWQANFIVLSIILACVLILFTIFCPETNHHIEPHTFTFKKLWNNYKALLTHPIFVGGTIISGIGAAITFTYSTISPFVLQNQFHLNAVEFGWLTGFAAAGGLSGKFITPFFIRHLGCKKTVFIGLIFLLFAGSSAGVIYFLQMMNVPLFLLVAFVAIFGQGCIMPNTFSLALGLFDDKRGTASALYGSFQMLVAFVTTTIAGSFAYDGAFVLAITYIILGIFGLSIYISLLSWPN